MDWDSPLSNILSYQIIDFLPSFKDLIDTDINSESLIYRKKVLVTFFKKTINIAFKAQKRWYKEKR